MQQILSKLLSDGQIDTETIMIGDRSVDIVAAHENRIRAAAVSWGHGSREELVSEGPEYFLKSPAELLN